MVCFSLYRADAHDSFRRDSRNLCQNVRRTRKKTSTIGSCPGDGHDHRNKAPIPQRGHRSTNEHSDPVGVEICGAHSTRTLPVKFNPTHSAIIFVMKSDDSLDAGYITQQPQEQENQCDFRSEHESPHGVQCLLNNWQCDQTKKHVEMPHVDTTAGTTMFLPLSSIELLRELDIPVTRKLGSAEFGGSGLTTARRKTDDGTLDFRNRLESLGPSSILATEEQADNGEGDDLSMGSIDYPDTMMMSEDSWVVMGLPFY